jgi:hypothetical protein
VPNIGACHNSCFITTGWLGCIHGNRAGICFKQTIRVVHAHGRSVRTPTHEKNLDSKEKNTTFYKCVVLPSTLPYLEELCVFVVTRRRGILLCFIFILDLNEVPLFKFRAYHQVSWCSRNVSSCLATYDTRSVDPKTAEVMQHRIRHPKIMIDEYRGMWRQAFLAYHVLIRYYCQEPEDGRPGIPLE